MKKIIITTLCAAALFTIPQSAFAGQKEKADKAGEAAGKVTAVGEGTITITSKKNGEQTFKTDSTTKFAKADGSAATATDIKVGARVKVAPGASPDQAAQISLHEPKAKDGAAKGDSKGGKKNAAKDAEAPQ